jgi:phosphate transport system substrate-binding protein
MKRALVGTLAVIGLGLGLGFTTSRTACAAPVTLNGSGSTLSKPYQETAIEEFKKANKEVKINYGGGGSGKGRQDLADMVVDFAGTDSPYKEADLAKVKGGEILYFPILLGPIAISFNVQGLDKLQLSPETLAKIFQRDIKKWNDKAIAADNPGAKLPDAAIVVAHRADGSGTTQNFTEYLNTAAKGVWKLKSGSTVEWPSDTQAGQGNAGVAQIIKATKGAIGYVDLSDAVASQLKYASVKNSAGKYIEPTPDSASAAGDGIDVKPDLTFKSVNSPAPEGYPITAPTWVIVYQNQADAAKGALIRAYVNYLVTTGQDMLSDIDYAPLPKSLQDKAVAQLEQIKTG